MKTEVTHWKKLTNPDYIGAHDLQPGQELKLTIESVSQERIKGADGRDEIVIIARIKNAKKPMILNKTNCKTITKIHKTPYIEEWGGKEIIIYAEKVKAFGDIVDALRIRDTTKLNKKYE